MTGKPFNFIISPPLPFSQHLSFLTMMKSHLEVFQSSVSRFASAPLFRIPEVDPSTGNVLEWSTITYQQFQDDVELYARHWSRVLRCSGIPRGSVIGLWWALFNYTRVREMTNIYLIRLSGLTYIDCIHIYGMSRAGYIPQMFSLRLPNPVVVYELLQRANAKALIYDACFESVLSECSIPTYQALKTRNIEAVNEELERIAPIQNENDVAFIFHTSGSTSGSPKLVPCSYRWMNTVVQKSNFISRPRNPSRQDVTVFMYVRFSTFAWSSLTVFYSGSMSHIAQTFSEWWALSDCRAGLTLPSSPPVFIGTLQHGSCVIQPSKMPYSSEELIDMIHRCGLNRLNAFGSWLGMHLKNSRQDPKLLSLLSGLDDVLYSGLAISRDDEQWALKNGLRLRVSFLHLSTYDRDSPSLL